MTKSALIVVDMQNDFMSGGTLEVPNSGSVITPVNQLIKAFDIVVATKDWHPADHSSFASQCGVKPFEAVDGNMKWPDHCVAGTWGSEFHKDLSVGNVRAVFHKGMQRNVESYSGFETANGGQSGLKEYLLSFGVDTVFVCGLALDYCVRATALHARNYFDTHIVSDATLPVDPNFFFDFESCDITLISTQSLPQVK